MPRISEPRTPLGAAIRQARMVAGFTSAKALADILGVDQSMVSQWELGKVSPRVDQLVEIEDACGVARAAVYLAGADREPLSEIEAALLAIPELTPGHIESILSIVHGAVGVSRGERRRS